MNRTMLKFLIFATIASTLALIYHPCFSQAQQAGRVRCGQNT